MLVLGRSLKGYWNKNKVFCLLELYPRVLPHGGLTWRCISKSLADHMLLMFIRTQCEWRVRELYVGCGAESRVVGRTATRVGHRRLRGRRRTRSRNNNNLKKGGGHGENESRIVFVIYLNSNSYFLGGGSHRGHGEYGRRGNTLAGPIGRRQLGVR